MTTTPEAPAAPAARLFRGLGDPTRLAVLLELVPGERRVSDIVEAVGGSQSNVSGHLACLKVCRLVVDRPAERRQVLYRLASDEVVDLLRAAERLLAVNGSAIALCSSPMMAGGAARG